MHNQAQAFNVLFTDLLEKLLSMADSPGHCSDYLAESLRSLIGVKTVLVMECAVRSGLDAHRVISAYPARRKEVGSHEAVQAIAEASHDISGTTLYYPGAEGPIPECLRRLGSGPTLVAPIQSADARMGVLILLDLLDTSGISTIGDTLDRLTPVFALILRNAFLYANLESEVAKRTRELEERQARLALALGEKEIMIKEIHHRVKNNLQIINSLLFLQADASSSMEVRDALRKSQSRIQSMALVHEELYRSDDLSSVEMRAYIPRLCYQISLALQRVAAISTEIVDVRLPITQSIPCGLLLNELAANALKHAYPSGEQGQIRVRLAEKDDILILTVEDDGVGMPSAAPSTESIGLSLVESLAEQLRGTLSYEPVTAEGRGSRFIVSFPKELPV